MRAGVRGYRPCGHRIEQIRSNIAPTIENEKEDKYNPDRGQGHYWPFKTRRIRPEGADQEFQADKLHVPVEAKWQI